MKTLVSIIWFSLLTAGCSSSSSIKLGEGNDITNAAINIPRAIGAAQDDKDCRNAAPGEKLACERKRKAETDELSERIRKAKEREEN